MGGCVWRALRNEAKCICSPYVLTIPSDFILSAIDRFLDPRRYLCWTTAWSSFARSLSRRSLC